MTLPLSIPIHRLESVQVEPPRHIVRDDGSAFSTARLLLMTGKRDADLELILYSDDGAVIAKIAEALAGIYEEATA